MKEALPIAAISLGVILVAVSLVWGIIFPATNQWTPEHAKEMSQLSDEVHLLMFKAAQAKEHPNQVKTGNPAEIVAEYEQKKKQLELLKKDLEQHQSCSAVDGQVFALGRHRRSPAWRRRFDDLPRKLV